MLKSSALSDKVYRYLTIIAVVLILFTVLNVVFSDITRANENSPRSVDFDEDGLTNLEELNQTREETRPLVFNRTGIYSEKPPRVENLELIERSSGEIKITWDKTDRVDMYNI